MPALYLPNGTIKAAESQLDNASLACEFLTFCFGALVIGSVITEFIIAHAEPAYSVFLIESSFTDVGVAVGIVGEVWFGVRNTRIQNELRRRSADRATEAEIEIERLLTLTRRIGAPRRVNVDVFAKSIEHLPKGRAIILYDRNVWDAWPLAIALCGGFEKAGWDTGEVTQAEFLPVIAPSIVPWNTPPQVIPGQAAFGISLTAKDAVGDAAEMLIVLTQALLKSGADFSVNTGVDPQLPGNTVVRLIVHAKAVGWLTPRPKETASVAATATD